MKQVVIVFGVVFILLTTIAIVTCPPAPKHPKEIMQDTIHVIENVKYISLEGSVEHWGYEIHPDYRIIKVSYISNDKQTHLLNDDETNPYVEVTFVKNK